MEEKPIDLSQITERIEFGKRFTPPYPVILGDNKLNPVFEAQQYTSFRQFQIRDKDVLKKLRDMLKPLIDEEYNIEYFKVKQKFTGPMNNIAVSFHSWYYSKAIEDWTDATDQEVKGELIVGAIAITEDILPITERSLSGRKANGLVFNGLGHRQVYIRKNCRWPRFENSFRLLHTKEDLDPEFITVCICDEYKEVVVTLHVAVFVINNSWF